MADEKIKFEDGAGYEKMMGTWSRLVGDLFLDWLAPSPGLRWADVGCGNGAFTQMLVDRCAPASVDGFDPSEAQLAFARSRPAASVAKFRIGDAMAAPFADRSFDAAVMALVIFFVPDPPKGVGEMARIVRPGGSVSAYAWDIINGGFPVEQLRAVMREMGFPPPMPPSVHAAELANLQSLWAGAGLENVEARQFSVERRFDSFEDLWTTSLLSASVGARVASMSPAQIQELKERFRASLQQDTSGPITCSARANAVKGTVPA